MKIIFKLFLLLVFIIQISNADNLKKVSLQLQWKHQFEFAGFYIAKEKGYYKDIGLDVIFKEFSSNINITDDVVSGKTTFGINYPNVIYEKANGKDVVILSAILQSSPHVLLTLESSGINSIKDFKDKTIMTSQAALIDAPFISMLEKNKLSFEDLKKIPHSFNIDDIIQGKADIISVFTSNELFKLKQKNIKYKIWDPREYGFDFYDVILFTSSKQIKTNPKMVEAFKKASLKGWEYAFSNIDETVELILNKYNTQNKTKEALIYEAEILKELAYFKTNTLGEIDPNKIQRIFDIYNFLGYAKNTIDLDKFIYKEKNISLSKKEKEYLQSLAEIKVFAIDNNKPLSYIENENSLGYANELFKVVAKKLNLKINWIKNMSYGESLQALKKGDIDVKSVYSHFRTSRDFVTPSTTVISAPFTVVGRFDSEPIKSINDLKEKRVVLVKGYQQTLTIKQDFPQIKFKTVNNINEAYSLIRSAEADYYIDHAIHSSFHLRENLLNDLKIAGELPKEEMGELNLYFGINSSMPLLHSSIQKALASIDEKQIHQLKAKWLISNKDIKFALTKEEKEYLQKNKTFTLCEQYDIYPLSGVSNGKLIGMRGDYINHLEKKLGLKFNILEANSFKELKQKLEDNQCDLVGSLASGTKEFFHMKNTNTIMDFSYGVMGDIKSFNMGPHSNLREHTFIVRFNAIKKKILEAYPNLNILVINDIDTAISEVKGKTHLVALRPVVERVIQDYGFDKYKLNGVFEGITQRSTMGVHEKHPLLLSIINKNISQIDPSFINRIYDKYTIKEFKIEKSYNKYLFLGLGLITLISFFIFYRSILIKRQNKDLEKRVEKRTKELQDINSSLEERIQIEVEKNRKKDYELYEQSKLASMGEMIGNIAHQWRQPLSVISTGATGLKFQKEYNSLTDEEFNKICDSINDNAQYLSKTIDDFKNFIKGDRKKKKFSLKKCIDSYLNLVQGSIKSYNIELILDLDENIVVNGYENELIQCLINLFNNAKDALVENSIEDKYIFIKTYQDDNNVIVSIKDNAGGIPKDIENKIFEPYFTTKHQSQGTGLGLSMTYSLIIDGMDGVIEVNNETYTYHENKHTGANFIIKLPNV